MKKLLALLMAMTLMFTFFVVAEAEDGAYTRTSDWKVEIGSEHGGMWAVELAFTEITDCSGGVIALYDNTTGFKVIKKVDIAHKTEEKL